MLFQNEQVICLEFGGSEKPIDVMIFWAFVMDRELNLVHVVSQDFLPGFVVGR